MFLRPSRALAASLVAMGLIFGTGCGKEATPVTAETSKFRSGTKGEATPQAAADGAATAADQSAAAIDGQKSLTASSQPATSKTGSRPAASSQADPAAPPATAAAPEVPAGNVKQLKAYIIDLGTQQPKGATQQEMLADFLGNLDMQIAAVNKILDSEPSEEDRVWAVSAAREIFGGAEQAGLPGIRERIKAFAKALSQRKDPGLARQGRAFLFSIGVVELITKSPDDGSGVVAHAQQFLAGEQADLQPGTLAQVAQTANVLASTGLRKDAVAVLNAIADSAAASKDEKVAAQEHTYRDRAAILELDLDTLGRDLLAGEKDADKKLVAAIKSALGKVQPSAEAAREVQNMCSLLDITGHSPVALECLTELETLFKRSTNKELAAQVQKTIDNARLRASLVGQPFSVEGVTHEGQPFDWADYRGKVVLIDFWASWCEPCMQELPNIQRNYEEFRDLGFEVVGVNLDANPDDLNRFFRAQELPWKTVVSQEVLDGKVDQTDSAAFTKLPMAAKCGVDGIPFLVLVGKDGKVDSLHVRGPQLRSKLIALLGDPDNKPSDAKPEERKPAEPKAAEAGREKARPTSAQPDAQKQSAVTPAGLAVAMALLSANEPAEGNLAASAPAATEDPTVNPYAAKPGLSSEQLAAYILKMLDKPKTIQSRPGFCEAVCEACDRLMAADPPATEVQFFVAAESKFETLHKKACTGDAEADKLLVAFVEKMKDDQRPRVARQVAFFQQERKVLDAIEAPVENVSPVLDEMKEYFAKEKLGAKHLRMASSTVALINRLEDGDKREEHFGAFGKTFATSSDKELARYGKKLAKKPAATESDLVGKPLELVGTTAKGADFAWDAYRGKVVLVDFWATWCGPCLQEMPHVQALHEKLHDRGFEVVGISLDEDQEALAAYLEENEIVWETLAGEGTQELAEKYSVRGIPTMMLVDKDGKIAGVAHNVAALAPLAEKLLKATAQ